MIKYVVIESMIFLILFRISWTDLRERRIRKLETLALIFLGSCLHKNWYDGWMGALLCGGIPELINLVAADLRGIGGGDIRLMFAAGWILGVEKGFYALFFAGVLALGSAALVKWQGKGELLKEGIAFGPFLSVGIGGILLWQNFLF